MIPSGGLSSWSTHDPMRPAPHRSRPSGICITRSSAGTRSSAKRRPVRPSDPLRVPQRHAPWCPVSGRELHWRERRSVSTQHGCIELFDKLSKLVVAALLDLKSLRVDKSRSHVLNALRFALCEPRSLVES